MFLCNRLKKINVEECKILREKKRFDFAKD